MENKSKKLIYSLLVLLLGFFSSCSNEDKNRIDDVEDLVLSSSAETIVLEEELVGKEALVLNWNRGSYKITEYRLEMDLKGNSFSQKVDFILPVDGKPTLSFRHEQLNNLIEQSWPTLRNKQGEFEVRVCGLDNGEISLESNMLSLKITPYTEEPLAYENLWISGDAVGELSPEEAHMTYDNDLKKFVWEGKIFTEGGFVFRTNLNSNIPAYCKGENDNSVQLITDETIQTNFTVSQDNYYRIEMDTRKKIISLSVVEQITDKITIIGALCGWDIWNAPELTKVSTNVYVYEGALPEGEFKFRIGISEGSYWPDWPDHWRLDQIMPLYNGQPLSDTNCFLNKFDGSYEPDYKWYVSSEEAGNYKITLNTGIMKIFIIKQ